jgi:hypothetical protein
MNASADRVVRTLNGADAELDAFAADYAMAARQNTFTELDFEGPGGPSPVFTTSLVLIHAAYAFALIDDASVWTTAERNAVIAWGNRLNANQAQKREFASPDSIATTAAARLAWGAATGQADIFVAGYADFRRTGALLNAKRLFEENPRDNNEVTAMMVLAVATLNASGLDGFGHIFNGVSIDQAVEAHALQTLALGPIPIRESDNGFVGTYFQTRGFVANTGWVPIYLSHRGHTPEAEAVRALNTAVKAKDPQDYRSDAMGGYTECLWGAAQP